jgi:hypothetical protein
MVDRVVVTAPPPRPLSPHVASYLVLDPGLKHLRTALSMSETTVRESSEKYQRQFEHAVARLFSLAGLLSDALGGFSGLHETVDVLARTTDGRIILPVECTLGARGTRAKLNNLLSRAAELRDAKSLKGTEIVPVIATSRTRDKLSNADLDGAALDEVVVLTAENLRELVEMLERGAGAGDVMRYLRQQVPITNGHAGRAWTRVQRRLR